MANYIEESFGICPYCKRSIHATYNKVINLSYRIDHADEFKNQTLNMASCIFCENTFRYETEIFAFDLLKGFAIIVNTDEAKPSYAHLRSEIYNTIFNGKYKLRFVNTCQEMFEKVLIFNLGIDDRMIEIIKQKYFPQIMDVLDKHHRFLLTDVLEDTYVFTLYDEHDRFVSEEKIKISSPDYIDLPAKERSDVYADFKQIGNKWAKEYINGGIVNE